MRSSVTVRFAPSPTGALHMGSIRTALYNYLLAKKEGGLFILRIEDTDQKRFVPSAEQYILESLRWLGIFPDESPTQGNGFSSYKQSERMDIYKQYLQPLLDSGHAYYAFDTPAEIEAMRERLKAAKIVSPQYNAVSRAGMKNGLTMPVEQVQEWIRTGKPYVVRLKMPHKTEIRFHDVIRGWVKVNTSVLDDKVLMKSDGLPTYHFANVVDDYLMKITHVIRGEEWLPSTPMHVLLYRYLGWTDYMPQFIHLPLLLAPNGKGKLSKRHAHEYGFPAFPIAWHAPDLTVSNGFREQGYLPEALLNFLALLGWNPGTNQEIFTKEELIAAFSLERLGKSAAVFDIAKANWFNQQHIKKLTKTVWASYFIAEAAKDHIQCSEKEAMAICTLVKDSITFPQDFWAEGSYFLCDPIGYNSDFLQKKWNPHSKSVMLCFTNSLLALTEWNQHNLKQLLQEAVYTHHSTMGSIMPLLRIVLTGRTTGPDLMEIIVLLGKDTTHKRLTTFLEKVKT